MRPFLLCALALMSALAAPAAAQFVNAPADPEWSVPEIGALPDSDDSRLVLNCSFSMSQHCRLVEEGEETVTVTKRRVVCEEPAFSAAA